VEDAPGSHTADWRADLEDSKLVERARDGTLLSISHWETHDEAEKAAVAAREWVAANLADRIELLENNTGDYLFLS
jgi:hypothetical protein